MANYLTKCVVVCAHCDRLLLSMLYNCTLLKVKGLAFPPHDFRYNPA